MRIIGNWHPIIWRRSWCSKLSTTPRHPTGVKAILEASLLMYEVNFMFNNIYLRYFPQIIEYFIVDWYIISKQCKYHYPYYDRDHNGAPYAIITQPMILCRLHGLPLCLKSQSQCSLDYFNRFAIWTIMGRIRYIWYWWVYVGLWVAAQYGDSDNFFVHNILSFTSQILLMNIILI